MAAQISQVKGINNLNELLINYTLFLRHTTEVTESNLEQSQSAICQNLSYSLDQLVLSSDADGYRSIVDSVVVGPCALKDTELELFLSIQSDPFIRSKINGGLLKKRFGFTHSGIKGIKKGGESLL